MRQAPQQDTASTAAPAAPRKQRKRAATRAVPRLAFTMAELLEAGLFTSRNKLYDAIARGDLRTYLDGKRRMATPAAVQDYQSLREQASG
jgi:hypothetical protein